MFEDQLPKSPAPPEPQDMFAAPPANLPTAPTPAASGVLPQPTPVSSSEASSAAGGPPGRVTPTAAPAPTMPMMPEMSEHHGSGVKTALMVIGGLLIVGVAGFIAYKLIVAPKTEEETDTTSTATPTVPVVTTPTSPEPEPVVEEEPVVDSDGDGLSDDQEAVFGTDPRLPDTDKDGLGDKEEVQVYGTDPLDPDTDGDGYLDGQEVSSGFNPNGEGKLFQVPR